MRNLMPWNVLLLATGLVLCAAGSDGRADAKKKQLSSQERQEIDASIYRLFRHVINKGADLYNAGDTAGCYRLYEHGLLTVRPLLNHRPELQEAIDSAVTAAAQEPRQYERAFILRRVIDQLRAAVKPEAAVAPRAAEPAAPKAEPKKEEPKKTQPPAPKAEPKKEEPKKEEPKVPAPKTDEPKKSEPKTPAPPGGEPRKPPEKKVEKRAG